jgi:hypothetical protein
MGWRGNTDVNSAHIIQVDALAAPE